MLTATLTTAFDTTSLQLRANGFHIANYQITHDDGDGPIPAAEAVLTRNGWKVVGEWDHVSGGISGDVWMVSAEQAIILNYENSGAATC